MRTAEAAAALQYLEALGFSQLPLRHEGRHGLSPQEKANALADLRLEIGECRRCKLSRQRNHVVFGEGSPDAELMFIGEGPGREEDLKARPFVGDAGQLLTRLIKRMGMSREEVYIGNIVKCRPPGNRDPEPDEIAACIPFIKAQMAIIQPETLMALGRIAAQTLTGKSTPISRLRGNFYEVEGVLTMPTFHPAYLLRNPSDKKLVWEDAQKVLGLLGRQVD